MLLGVLPIRLVWLKLTFTDIAFDLYWILGYLPCGSDVFFGRAVVLGQFRPCNPGIM